MGFLIDPNNIIFVILQIISAVIAILGLIFKFHHNIGMFFGNFKNTSIFNDRLIALERWSKGIQEKIDRYEDWERIKNDLVQVKENIGRHGDEKGCVCLTCSRNDRRKFYVSEREEYWECEKHGFTYKPGYPKDLPRQADGGYLHG